MVDEQTNKPPDSTSTRNKLGRLRKLIMKIKYRSLLPPVAIVIFLSVFNPIISAILTDISLEGPGKAIKAILFNDERLRIELISSTAAPFQTENSIENMNLLSYKLSASELFTDVTVSAVFAKGTEIVRTHVLYSVDLKGFHPDQKQKNHIVLHLDHSLHSARQAEIFFWTSRQVKNREDIRVKLPQIEVRGKDKNGSAFHSVVN